MPEQLHISSQVSTFVENSTHYRQMKLIALVLPAIMMTACGSGTSEKAAAETPDGTHDLTTAATWPQFNADSAYSFTAQQVKFGPRVPGTTAHRQCRDYIASSLNRFGADTVLFQEATVTAFNGKRLPMTNIIARFNTVSPRRILVAAHYDTRPWADEDSEASNRTKPIDGANDGASGVGVILELARNIGQQQPEIGVDFLLTDVEDYGSHDDDPYGTSSWALGSQYWAANNTYTPRERPAFGILIDMVGGRGALFYREHFSESAAQWVNTKVWNAAAAEGIKRFVDERQGGVTDDHIFITGAGIPCIDIIECANPKTGSFPESWHTMDDTMDNIDPTTLGDVGRTLMRVIFTEKAQ